MPHSMPSSRGQPPGHLEGVLVLDLDHFVDDVDVQHVGDEAGADALDLVPARLERLARHAAA